MRLRFLSSIAACALAACAATGEDSGSSHATVTGQATFHEKLLMPADSVLAVELVDLADGNRVLHREEFESTPGPPYGFTLRYPTSAVPDGASLAVHAALFDPRGERMFVTAEPVPVEGGHTRPAEFRMSRSP